MQEAMHGISLEVCSRHKSLHLSFTDTGAPVEERAGMAHILPHRSSGASTLEGKLPWLVADFISKGRNSIRYAGRLPLCLWLGRGHCESHKAITSVL